MKNKIDNSVPVVRSYTAEIRADTEKGNTIVGRPAVYGEKTAIGNWFYEIIERNAFDGCDFDDVPFLINHDENSIPVARSRRNNGNSSMKLSVDDKGVEINALLDIEKNTDAARLYSAVERGDISGMSFKFQVSEDRWENLDSDMPTRHILKIAKVFEVSAVNHPAYSGTSIDARSGKLLDNDLKALENARASALDNVNKSELALLKAKNQNLGG